MKKRILGILLSASLAFSFLTPTVLFTGCGGTPETRQATSYKTLKSVQLAVDAAMKVYATRVVTGKVSVEKQAEIDAKHTQYRAAFRAVVVVARNDLAAIPPADLQALANELQLIISQLE